LRDDTIFALSSAAGRAGVAVVRVSGPGAGDAVRALAGPEPLAPRRATVRRIGRPQAIDDGLLLWFPAPASFTGEDIVEFQIHGGHAVVSALLEALGRVPGLRPAEPGEFTRRAVENGKFDLTAAEGLSDLIAAETDAQRRQALRQKEGALAALYEAWRERLIAQAAWLEATIDFADEDLPDDVFRRARAALSAVSEEIARHLDDGGRGELVRDGVRITLLGAPNAGKSSLLNALARRDVAIVAATPGTTRDVLEVRLDLGGYAVTVSDTAGLRDTADAVESEGVRRAQARAADADIVVLVVDGVSGEIPALGPGLRPAFVLMNKSDLIEPGCLGPASPSGGIRASGHLPRDVASAFSSSVYGGSGPALAGTEGIVRSRPITLPISVLTGAGLDGFVSELTESVRILADRPQEAAPLTRARHRQTLEEARSHLERAQALPDDRSDLMAEDLRLAMRAIGRLTGRVDVEELLDVIFRDFCIGK
jgi:tRNA modification GTPase